jgi:Tol biopolymer transport system component
MGVSPDGQSVIFNRGMPVTSQSGFSLLYDLMDIRVASAHNLPSDIWIAKSGETPKQLSHLNGYGFVADFSPDGQFIAFSCDTGVYVMRADGTEQTKISNVSSFSMLQWAS